MYPQFQQLTDSLQLVHSSWGLFFFFFFFGPPAAEKTTEKCQQKCQTSKKNDGKFCPDGFLEIPWTNGNLRFFFWDRQAQPKGTKTANKGTNSGNFSGRRQPRGTKTGKKGTKTVKKTTKTKTEGRCIRKVVRLFGKQNDEEKQRPTAHHHEEPCRLRRRLENQACFIT